MLYTLALLMIAQAAAAPPPAPPNCHDTAHAAYDFFVGDWDVTDTKSGVAVARSRIEKIMDDCAIKESFEQSVGAGGKAVSYHGTSYTALGKDGRWHQFYVDSGGGAASYTGDVNDRTMTLDAPQPKFINRMIVALQPDGTVHQSGRISTDDGKTWSAPGYEFTYTRHKS